MRREKKRHEDPNTQLLFVSTCRHTYILAMVLEEVVVVVKKMTMFEKNNKQAQRRAAAGRSRHKRHGVIQHQGSYFRTRCTKWIFIILIVLVEKTTH